MTYYVVAVRDDLVVVFPMGQGQALGQRDEMMMLQREDACLKNMAMDMTQHGVRRFMWLIFFVLPNMEVMQEKRSCVTCTSC